MMNHHPRFLIETGMNLIETALEYQRRDPTVPIKNKNLSSLEQSHLLIKFLKQQNEPFHNRKFYEYFYHQ